MIDTVKIFVPIKNSQIKLKEKGSLFLAQLYYADSCEIALEILQNVKKKYFDATHNCYAYRIFPEINKFSDDGEPKGSAGIRINNAIQHFSLFNALVIVTRYFGGTKLGVGPLGNAYYSSAFEAIDKSAIKEAREFLFIKIQSDYSHSSLIYKIFQDFESKNIQSKFEENFFVSAFIPKNQKENFLARFNQNKSFVHKLEIDENSKLF